MKLFLISQSVNSHYDTYDSAVVIAKDAQDACTINPRGDDKPVRNTVERFSSWCSLKDVQVELLGKAKIGSKRGVVCASFNAG